MILISAARFATPLLRLVYPPICAGCEAAIGKECALCPRCWRSVTFIERPYCEMLGAPFAFDPGDGILSPAAIAEPPPFARARASVVHRDLAARLVARMKYGDRIDLAPMMAAWMARAGGELLAEAEAVVPVPLHRSRLWRRRFNQSAELARILVRRHRLAYRPATLARVKATRAQVGLGPTERRRNVQGAFRVPETRQAEIAGRRILLIDDVFTTGSTAASAARALLKAGASAVDVLTFSRVAEGGPEPHMGV